MGGSNGGIPTNTIAGGHGTHGGRIMANADMKMDKVRRLLGNRYGDDARVAIIDALGKINADNPIFDGVEEGTVELALNAIKDIVTRANKEPVPRKSKEGNAEA